MQAAGAAEPAAQGVEEAALSPGLWLAVLWELCRELILGPPRALL